MPPENKGKAKHGPTALLIHLEKDEAELLGGVFRQFSIASETVSGDVAKLVNQKKFEACVLRLDEGAERTLQTLRDSARNRNVPILGICSSTPQALRFSKYGINALLRDPLERQDAMRGVRSAHLLIIHELRRYIRVPIVLECVMDLMGGGKVAGLTRDLSYGGMSVITSTRVSVDHAGEVSFKLPNETGVKVGATILWRHEPELVGLRFEPADDRRLQLRPWIDDYLKLT
ncbi:MAG TPA: PilZ domain-containing protein [Terriglobales bacterium]|nr:PilZ domain-containing protein [Terriglobales bacterium]